MSEPTTTDDEHPMLKTARFLARHAFRDTPVAAVIEHLLAERAGLVAEREHSRSHVCPAPIGMNRAEWERQVARMAELETALREIADGAPEKDPGEGEWTSLEDAYIAGQRSQHFDSAEIARDVLAPTMCAEHPDRRAVATVAIKIDREDTGERLHDGEERGVCDACAEAVLADMAAVARKANELAARAARPEGA